MTGGAAALEGRTVGGRLGGATPRLFGLVRTFLGALSEGACGEGWSGVATLGGGLLRETLGGGDASWGDTTSKFSGAGVVFGARR